MSSSFKENNTNNQFSVNLTPSLHNAKVAPNLVTVEIGSPLVDRSLLSRRPPRSSTPPALQRNGISNNNTRPSSVPPGMVFAAKEVMAALSTTTPASDNATSMSSNLTNESTEVTIYIYF
jgi:hypothetical protein